MAELNHVKNLGTGADATLSEGNPSDAEKNAHPDNPDAYDVEFEYLGNKDKGVDKTQDDANKETTETKEGETTETKEGDTLPKIKDEDVPPVDKVTETTETHETTPTDTDVKYKELDTKYNAVVTERDTLKQEVTNLQAVKVALDEIQKDPHAFIARFLPDFAATIDPHKVVNDTLQKEFGAELSSYSDADRFTEGTVSYKIRQREQQLLEQMQRQRVESEVTRSEEARRREAIMQESKSRVMKQYGLTEEQFQKEIVQWSKDHDISKDPFTAIAKLRYFDWHISNAVKQAVKRGKNGNSQPLPKSATTVSGRDQEVETESKEYKEFVETFGD